MWLTRRPWKESLARFQQTQSIFFWSAAVTLLNGHAEISGRAYIVCRLLHSKADVVYPGTVEVGNGHVVVGETANHMSKASLIYIPGQPGPKPAQADSVLYRGAGTTADRGLETSSAMPGPWAPGPLECCDAGPRLRQRQPTARCSAAERRLRLRLRRVDDVGAPHHTHKDID